MKKILFIISTLLISNLIYAQKKQNIIEDVETIPLGDGRYQWRDPQSKKPLKGEYRVIIRRDQYAVVRLKDGLLNGTKEDYRDNYLYAKSNYKNGRLNGKSIMYYPDGEISEQKCFNDKGELHGKLISYNPGGSVEKEAYYVDGKQEGSYKSYMGNKLFIEANYKNDNLYGIKKVYNDDYTSEGFYLDNLTQKGEYKETWTNGKPKKVEYYSDEGKKQGIWREWYKDGTLAYSRDYDKAKQESFHYHQDGSTDSHHIFNEEGEIEFSEEFYPQTNVVKIEKNYYRPFHFTFKVYYDDGKLREEGRSENGFITSVKKYYRNQQLRSVEEVRKRGYGYTIEVVEMYDEKGNALPIQIIQ